MTLTEGRRRDLEKKICEAEGLIAEYEEKILLGGDPRDVARWRKEVEELKKLLAGYQAELAGEAGAPFQAPPPIRDFVGREKEIEDLEQALAAGSRLAIWGLQGMAGIGKTALAIHLAHRLRGRFPDGVLWVTMRTTTPLGAMAAIAGAYGLDVAGYTDEASRGAAVRGLLATKRALLVLDDVQRAEDVRELLPGSGTCAVLLTSRDRGALAAAEVYPLGRMADEEALELFARTLGTERAAREKAELLKLAEAVGCLPLALDIAAHTLQEAAGLSVDKYLRLLGEAKGKWLKHGEQDVWGAFEVSWQKVVEPEARRLFARLGAFAGADFSVEAAAALVGMDETEAALWLGRLAGRGLAEAAAAGRYRLHPLLKDFALDKLREMGEEDEAWAAHLDYYLTFAQANAQVDPAAHARLEMELADLLAAAEWAHETGRHKAVSELGFALYGASQFLDVKGHYRQAVQLLNWSMEACRALGDKWNEGVHLGNLGNAYASLGRVEEAIGYYQQALDIAREIGDRSSEGNWLGNLGNAYASLGRVEEAIGYYQQALDIAREIGDRRGEGSDLGNLGLAYYALGRVEEAIGYYQQALDIAREIGDRSSEGNWLGNLGNAYYTLGRVEEAIGYYQQALDIAREIGDRRGEGTGLGNLGLAYASLGRVEEAIGYYQQALAIFREIGDRRGEGSDLGNLGLAYADLGRVEEAIGYYQQALDIAREIGDRRREGNHLGNLGDAYRALGQLDKALACHTEGLRIAQEIGDRHSEAYRHRGLGEDYKALGDVEQARAHLERALALFTEMKSLKAEEVRAALRRLGAGD
jgi:tetratricopeptide (TPR) repeat protein